MTREEYYRKREERGAVEDRRYRKEKERERGDRYRDDKRKGKGLFVQNKYIFKR